MTIRVLIVAYGDPAALERCLRTVGRAAPVTVVDNSSSDTIQEFAFRFGASYIDAGENRGFSAGVNVGLRSFEADPPAAVLLLNPDAALTPSNLERLTAYLADPRSRRVAAVAPQLVGEGGEPQRVVWPFPTPFRAWLEAIGLGRLRSRTSFVIGAVMLLRWAAIRDVGLFDERFFLYSEETDWLRRARDRGWRSAVCAEAVAEHVGAGTSEDRSRREALFHAGQETYIRKWHGRFGWAAYRAAAGSGSFVRALVLRGRRRRDAWDRFRLYLRGPRRAAGVGSGSIPESARAGSTHQRLELQELVVCSLKAWDEVWNRNNFLTEALLRRNPRLRVLFVEPPSDPLFDLAQRRRPVLPRFTKITADGCLIAFRPVKPSPRRLGRWVDAALRGQVKLAARRLGFSAPVLWVNDVTYAPLIASTGWPSVYDVSDDWLLAPFASREVERLRALDEIALADADEVVVCSPTLAASRGRTRPVSLVQNAVDVEHFRRPRPRPRDLPESPVVVYAGTTHDARIDVPLVADLASALPEVRFAFVGPDAFSFGSRRQLEQFENVVFLGPRPYDDLPAYLQHADAVFVPHIVSPFMESLDPIKAYECLAINTPTVATPLPGFREHAEDLHIADRASFSLELADVLAGRAARARGGGTPRPGVAAPRRSKRR